jgi:hypothetical protein
MLSILPVANHVFPAPPSPPALFSRACANAPPPRTSFAREFPLAAELPLPILVVFASTFFVFFEADLGWRERNSQHRHHQHHPQHHHRAQRRTQHHALDYTATHCFSTDSRSNGRRTTPPAARSSSRDAPPPPAAPRPESRLQRFVNALSRICTSQVTCHLFSMSTTSLSLAMYLRQAHHASHYCRHMSNHLNHCSLVGSSPTGVKMYLHVPA